MPCSIPRLVGTLGWRIAEPAKDGIYPLTGVIETDWSPYTFTMNWRFTRRNHRVHFDAGEPYASSSRCSARYWHGQPADSADPSELQLAAHHAAWRGRGTPSTRCWSRRRSGCAPTEQWQRRYFRGLDMTEQPVVPDHISKLRTAPFNALRSGRTGRARYQCADQPGHRYRHTRGGHRPTGPCDQGRRCFFWRPGAPHWFGASQRWGWVRPRRWRWSGRDRQVGASAG